MNPDHSRYCASGKSCWIRTRRKVRVRGGHQGVPPDGAVVAVTELQSPDVASQQQIKTFREGDGGDFRDVCGCGVFGDDLHQFGMGGDILKKLAECGFIEFGLVKIGKWCGFVHETTGSEGQATMPWRGFRETRKTAFFGAGQTSWQILQPVQRSGFTRGFPCSTTMAPVSRASLGTHRTERSLPSETKPVQNKREWRPVANRWFDGVQPIGRHDGFRPAAEHGAE